MRKHKIPIEKGAELVERVLEEKQPVSHAYDEIVREKIFRTDYDPQLPSISESYGAMKYQHFEKQIVDELRRIADTYKVPYTNLLRLFTSRHLRRLEFDDPNAVQGARIVCALFDSSTLNSEEDRDEMADTILRHAKGLAELDSLDCRRYADDLIKMVRIYEEDKKGYHYVSPEEFPKF